jgi:hypothetical protein
MILVVAENNDPNPESPIEFALYAMQRAAQQYADEDDWMLDKYDDDDGFDIWDEDLDEPDVDRPLADIISLADVRAAMPA